MVFTSEIKGVRLLNPANKRVAEGGKVEEKWGEWDGAAVATGDINLECDNVLFCTVTDETAANAVQVERNTDGSGAKAGWVNLNFTSGHAGRFLAHCQYKS